VRLLLSFSLLPHARLNESCLRLPSCHVLSRNPAVVVKPSPAHQIVQSPLNDAVVENLRDTILLHGHRREFAAVESARQHSIRADLSHFVHGDSVSAHHLDHFKQFDEGSSVKASGKRVPFVSLNTHQSAHR
jgi:hypothetical protein